jgi:hypothetical protein
VKQKLIKAVKQMRDRLIELIKQGDKTFTDKYTGKVMLLIDEIEEIYDFIADYLLENGVIVPPCKVGDKVYYFSENPLCLSVQPYRIYEADVVRIVTVGLGTSLVIQIRNEYGCTEIPDVNEWGKTVFFTREEAEQALKGGEG